MTPTQPRMTSAGELKSEMFVVAVDGGSNLDGPWRDWGTLIANVDGLNVDVGSETMSGDEVGGDRNFPVKEDAVELEVCGDCEAFHAVEVEVVDP